MGGKSGEGSGSELERTGYRFAGPGRQAAAKVCEWTRKSLRGEGTCYKQKWYGIESHRCLQCTLSLRCNTRCAYCWRSFKAFSGVSKTDKNVDDPEVILKDLVRNQRLLLSGFGGFRETEKKKWEEAKKPTNFAISLIGESLFYPRLSDFIELIRKKGGSTFLVTKGTLPEELKSLDELPTNLYISVCAPDRGTFRKLDRPLAGDGWERQMESLEFMNSVSCRKVIRVTAVKGHNMKNPEGYAKLIGKANPDFIEIKAYMHLGESQSRLPRDAMPFPKDVERFAKEVADASAYTYRDFFGPSRVALLSRK
jgi:tRNA wybutosine-synthesizing protein 1